MGSFVGSLYPWLFTSLAMTSLGRIWRTWMLPSSPWQLPSRDAQSGVSQRLQWRYGNSCLDDSVFSVRNGLESVQHTVLPRFATSWSWLTHKCISISFKYMMKGLINDDWFEYLWNHGAPSWWCSAGSTKGCLPKASLGKSWIRWFLLWDDWLAHQW